MKAIRLRKNTGLDEIRSEWSAVDGEEIHFHVSQDSSLQALAEGVALAYLREFVLRNCTVRLELHAATAKKSPDEIIRLCRLFTSIFGLELLRTSVSVEGATRDGARLRQEIGSMVWKLALSQKGTLRDGKSAYFISRHGYRVPVALRSDSSTLSFPPFDTFLKTFRLQLINIMGRPTTWAPFRAPFSEGSLIGWLHEVAENAHQHGDFDGSVDDGIPGHRGTKLQKLAIGRWQDLDIRGDIPDPALRFIAKHSSGSFTSFGVATVMDLGLGIHKTIPNSTSHGSDLDRLNSAFVDGVSRKPKGSDERAGFGLGKAIDAARSIGALLHVVSCDIEAWADLTTVDRDRPFTRTSHFPKSCGTAVSVIWPSK